MVVAFLILAGVWVLAWVVLIVLGLVKILFPTPDGAYENEHGFSVGD
jgi:hypothetical protein